MNAKKILNKIFISGGRGSGRTHATIEALKQSKNAIMVVHNQQFADDLKRRHPDLSFCTLRDLDSDKFTGRHDMFLPDHFVLEILFNELCAGYEKMIDTWQKEQPK